VYCTTVLYYEKNSTSSPLVSLLLSRGADPNAVEPSNRFTPLHASATAADATATATLLAGGANPLARDANNVPPRGMARKYPEIEEMLFQAEIAEAKKRGASQPRRSLSGWIFFATIKKKKSDIISICRVCSVLAISWWKKKMMAMGSHGTHKKKKKKKKKHTHHALQHCLCPSASPRCPV
jgi:hypothetical protein